MFRVGWVNPCRFGLIVIGTGLLLALTGVNPRQTSDVRRPNYRCRDGASDDKGYFFLDSR